MVEVLTLKKRQDFLRAAKGFKTVVPSLVLQAAQSLSPSRKNPQPLTEGKVRVGFTATKKLGKAHVRNRTKRRLRAVAREYFPLLGRPNTDYVIIGRYNTADIEFSKLRQDLKNALKRINKLFPGEKEHEKPAQPSADIVG